MAEDVREEKDPGEAEVIYETDDGFRGTHDEVVAHEERRKHLLYEEHKKEMEAQIQALKEENEKHHENVGQLESLAAEHKETLHGKLHEQHGRHDVLEVFQSHDGFHGTLEEVIEHEKKMGYEVDEASDEPVAVHKLQVQIYEAEDGFQGTLEEMMEHEKAKEIDAGHNFLTDNGLGQFLKPLHTNGIDSLDQLRSCSDEFLTTTIEMKKAHLLKFRRALSDAENSASGQLEESAMREHMENGVTIMEDIYEADGFRGTYEEVLEHEKALKGGHKGTGIHELFEAPDGFRGTYEEVLEHERNQKE